MKLKATLTKKVKFWLDNQPNHLIFLRPKLYFAIKSGLLLAIIIQRIVFLVDSDSENKSYTDYFQLGGFILLFLMEGAMFRFILKNKKAKRFSEFLFCGFQILFSEFIIALSTALSSVFSENFEDELLYIIQQEILFVFILMILFTDSFIIKSSLFFYITPTFLFRLSPSLPATYYIGWVLMTLTMLTTCLIIFISPEKSMVVSKEKKDFANLENIPHGLAILTRDREVIFMNGVFKGMLELTNEKDALNKIMKLKRFEAYSEQDQQHFLQEIKVRNSFNVSKEKELQKQATGGKNRFISLLSRRLTKKSTIGRNVPGLLTKKSTLSPGNVPAIMVNRPNLLEHTDSLRKNIENQLHQSTSFGTTTLGKLY